MTAPHNERPSTEDVRVSGWPICDKCGANVLKPEYLMERVAELEAENQRLRDELRSEMMERSDAEREADRLRAAIEKLRDDVKDNLHDSDFVLSGWVARRLTEMLEGDFQEQLDRARVKYRGALDELRDK